MCKPVKEYMGVVREYTREIITFGGFALCCFIYKDFREVARAQAETAAKTAEILHVLDARVSNLEQWHARSDKSASTPAP